MSWALTFLGLIALIILHELGHFAAAKAVGMRVERFSLFFPPRLFGVKIGETDYCVGALPLGGYVKIAGMAPLERVPRGRGGGDAGGTAAAGGTGRDGRSATGPIDAGHDGEAPPDDPRGYFRQPVWKRMLVIAAGPGMNVLIAFLILWGVYALSAQNIARGARGVKVDAIVPGQPAARVLRRGDVLLAIDGHRVAYEEPKANRETDVARYVDAHRCAGATADGCRAATPVRLTLRRGARELRVAVYPVYSHSVGRMLVGFSYGPPRFVSAPIGAAAGQSVSKMWEVTSLTLSRIGQIFTSEHARKELHGIVGISDVASQAFSYEVPEAMLVLALISLSLAIVNLFPFLPLDGGHLFWAAAEKVRGRAIPFWVMERASVVGFLLVGFIAIIGFSNDISALQNGGLTLHR
jgi:regulator of sigma E protease